MDKMDVMKQILCFGDSNTYGLIPKSEGRYPWEIRWTGILNKKLGLKNYRVIEEGLPGRTTIFDDPLRKGRCGVQMLPVILETHRPIDIVVVMLGTNDCKTVYGATAEVIGEGITNIIEQICTYAEGSKILLISPIHLGAEVWKKEYDPEFSAGSVSVSEELADIYKRISEKKNTYFLDAASYANPCDIDQEHLDEDGHRLLAEGIYNKIKTIL